MAADPRLSSLRAVRPSFTMPSPDQRKQILALQPSKRPVLGTWRSLDGRLYAYDGISLRRITDARQK